MTIKVGESLPNAKFMLVTPDGPKPVETKDYFGGKTVVLFGLPGAFTPTCHKNHLPGFIVNEAKFKGKGVDKIAMTAVNDHHVLKAWSEATGAEGHVDFLADGNGDFAKAVGLDLDLSAGGLGLRSKRYSMLVVDGVVKELNIEPETGTGGRLGRRASPRADQVGRGAGERLAQVASKRRRVRRDARGAVTGRLTTACSRYARANSGPAAATRSAHAACRRRGSS